MEHKLINQRFARPWSGSEWTSNMKNGRFIDNTKLSTRAVNPAISGSIHIIVWMDPEIAAGRQRMNESVRKV